MKEGKIAVTSNQAPAAVGPYSQGVGAGGFLFLSGQIALDPATGKMVGPDVASQTRQILKNMSAVLSAAGLEFQHVVRTTVYLRDMGTFAGMNAVYAESFPIPAPARCTVAVSGLPKDALVEIDAIAWRG